MNRDKQIEELSKDIFEHCSVGLFKDEATEFAHFVIEKRGYRKSTEVAREIFGMLREDLSGFVDKNYLNQLIKIYEKKYTEEKDK